MKALNAKYFATVMAPQERRRLTGKLSMGGGESDDEGW